MVENPEKFVNKYKLKSSRLLNWNYSSSGNYFITICTYNHNHFFGKIDNEKMIMSNRGSIAQQCLTEIPKHFSNTNLDEFVVMPNHIHMLICLNSPDIDNHCVETHDRASLQIKYQNYHFHQLAIKSNQTIPKIINQFKSSVKRICNNQNIYFSWQSRYHDHLVCDQKELSIIKNYIINNPQNWQKDKFYNSR